MQRVNEGEEVAPPNMEFKVEHGKFTLFNIAMPTRETTNGTDGGFELFQVRTDGKIFGLNANLSE